MIPLSSEERIPREALDETVLRVQAELQQKSQNKPPRNYRQTLTPKSLQQKQQYSFDLPYCAFNGGRDVWVDVGNKRVGVQILQSYLGVPAQETLHIGDQFLNTGNDYAARAVCPCIWITSPEETTYILKSILRLAGVSFQVSGIVDQSAYTKTLAMDASKDRTMTKSSSSTGFVTKMDVYTGEIVPIPMTNPK